MWDGTCQVSQALLGLQIWLPGCVQVINTEMATSLVRTSSPNIHTGNTTIDVSHYQLLVTSPIN